jgi:methionyl-tRNA formyltransferase
MKIALLTCDQPWQRTLAARLAMEHEIAVLVVDHHVSLAVRLRKVVMDAARSPGAVLRKLNDKIRLRTLERRDSRIYVEHFSGPGSPPFTTSASRVIGVGDVNTALVSSTLQHVAPDVIIVSGTRLIRSPVLDVRARFGMLNLHAGLSPYYRGGPCTFWTLYNEEPEYAGATVHHITPGIDSGDIVLSAQVRVREGDGVASLDCRVIESGHGLVLRALSLLQQGRAPRVPQWEEGRLFLYRQFTAEARFDLQSRLETGLIKRCLARQPRHLRTIDA